MFEQISRQGGQTRKGIGHTFGTPRFCTTSLTESPVIAEGQV
jgi:hypothetical protein